MDRDAILLRNNVNVRGDGDTTLLFAHGFGCDQTIWNQVAPQFYNKCKVVLFDYVGSGESDLNAYDEHRYDSLDGYAQDLVEVIKALDLDNIVLVAYSVSGSISAIAYPEIKQRLKHIVMLNPSPRYIHDEPDYDSGFAKDDVDQLIMMMEQNFFGWAQTLAPQVMENPERPELTEQLHQHFTAGENRIVRAFARATFYSDTRDQLSAVDCPVTILQADKDIVVPKQVAEYTAKQLPNARLIEIDARGHYPHVSAPDLIVRHIESLTESSDVTV
ncbi:MAG: hypothetical protein CMF12_03845 [Idiomarina sp.]|uniref:alpha/beta fold hydrolase n=1 Tax=Idiomarina sp. TaxID=1874361 RepID=UPI000C6AC57B|nr:alpha/beta hydrolase [Idiomarina sp.]MBT41636.1 hypothetical protein [Idiomarina sp.]